MIIAAFIAGLVVGIAISRAPKLAGAVNVVTGLAEQIPAVGKLLQPKP